jgi:hypothetical protein
MEMYLTRQHNGLYMLTALKPILSRVEGRDFEDAYVAPGEPVGMRNFCDIILRLVGIEKPLKRGETVKILLSGSLIT